MDAIGNNMDWLYEHMPRANYSRLGTNVNTNIKIAAGLAIIEPDTNGTSGRDVYFGDFFTPGTYPIVTNGVISDSIRRVHVTIQGITGAMHPDSVGFRAIARADEIDPSKNTFAKAFYVSWQALGY